MQIHAHVLGLHPLGEDVEFWGCIFFSGQCEELNVLILLQVSVAQCDCEYREGQIDKRPLLYQYFLTHRNVLDTYLCSEKLQNL